jgi:hypothetical protein
METRPFDFVASIPSVEDFGARFRQYKNHAAGEGRAVFDLLMTPEALIYSKVATEMEFPAVAGIAEKAMREIHSHREHTDFDKQFIGAVVCVLMEANGYHKTGTKKSIPHKDFTKGELYERNA